MEIFAGPARLRAANHPPSFPSYRLSTSTWTDARVLAAARGIRGACCAGAAPGWLGAGAAGCCALVKGAAAILAATARTGTTRMTRAPFFFGEKRRLEIPLLHFLEESLVLLTLLKRLGVGREIWQILVISLSEPFPEIGFSSLGRVFFGQRGDLLVVHDLCLRKCC